MPRVADPQPGNDDLVTITLFHDAPSPGARLRESGPPDGVPEHRLGLDVVVLGGAAIVRVSGRLDESTAPMLVAEMERLRRGGSAVLVVDLHDLPALSARGVTALRTAAATAERDGGAVRILAGAEAVLVPLRARPTLDVTDTSGRLLS